MFPPSCGHLRFGVLHCTDAWFSAFLSPPPGFLAPCMARIGVCSRFGRTFLASTPPVHQTAFRPCYSWFLVVFVRVRHLPCITICSLFANTHTCTQTHLRWFDLFSSGANLISPGLPHFGHVVCSFFGFKRREGREGFFWHRRIDPPWLRLDCSLRRASFRAARRLSLSPPLSLSFLANEREGCRRVLADCAEWMEWVRELEGGEGRARRERRA